MKLVARDTIIRSAFFTGKYETPDDQYRSNWDGRDWMVLAERFQSIRLGEGPWDQFRDRMEGIRDGLEARMGFLT